MGPPRAWLLIGLLRGRCENTHLRGEKNKLRFLFLSYRTENEETKYEWVEKLRILDFRENI
jgi:hypothetical protein